MHTTLESPDRRPQNKHLKSGRGRRWGSRNKIPIDLKRAALAAAEAHGSDGHGAGGVTGYLFHLADRHPKAFAMLLGKLLPLQLDADPTSGIVNTVRIISVPVGQYLSPEDLHRMSPPLEIDHEPEAQTSCEIMSDHYQGSGNPG